MYEIYRLLNKDTKSWWYHRQLREQGQTQKARELERASIREHTKILQQAVLCTVGRGGWTIYTTPRTEGNLSYRSSKLQGYGGMDEEIIQCCLLLNVPVINSLTIPDDDITKTISFPIPGIDYIDPQPWGSLSYAPIEHVARLYQSIGAEIYNLKV